MMLPEVGNVGSKDNPVSCETVVTNTEGHITQLPLASDALHHLEAGVEEIFLVEHCRLRVV